MLVGKNRHITVQSPTPGAEVSVDGQVVGVTPMMLRLYQSGSESALAGQPGWAAFDSIILVRGPNGQAVCDPDMHIGILWVVLDILFGLLPLLVDAVTGQWIENDTVCFAPV